MLVSYVLKNMQMRPNVGCYINVDKQEWNNAFTLLKRPTFYVEKENFNENLFFVELSSAPIVEIAASLEIE